MAKVNKLNLIFLTIGFALLWDFVNVSIVISICVAVALVPIFWLLMVFKKITIYRLLLFIIFCGGIYINGYRYEYRFINNRVISRTTGVSFPSYSVKRYFKSRRSFQGDYRDDITIKFKELPSIEFYQLLDKLSCDPESDWEYSENMYCYRKEWRDKNDDDFGGSKSYFYIFIKRGEKCAKIIHGAT
ncbi:hypothetical protein [uncultured Parabacteroides sp.]|uniref:hypothetical protein n=3 Tax=uncultured Parabacteroides sp. TaxID=512312 RepID=UPI002659E24F|nr:hypothetical protein [uncultured Parabacteroides sp.]